ncbi:IgGFc-binding protein-like [Anolis sagrei]|uniref:IgGFc-binding protein-like n=1 Tax=Anolis sagrei TaxID=38937 RepID=UPI0035208411
MGAKMLLVPVAVGLALLSGLHAIAPVGQEFITTFMQNYKLDYPQIQFQLFISSYSSSTAVTVSVYKSKFESHFIVAKGQTVAVKLPAEVEMVGTVKFCYTVLVRADQDISVLALNAKKNSADTTIVYPVHSLGDEYYVLTPPGDLAQSYKEFSVIAWNDETAVEIYLKGSVRFQERIYPAGSKLSVVLPPYEAVQFQSREDLSGTLIRAVHPVAVLSGHTCAHKNTNCNHVVEQLQPVSNWGREFFIPPLAFQMNYDLAYIVASQYTVVTYISGRIHTNYHLVAGQVLQLKVTRSSPIYITANVGIQVFFFCTGGSYSQLTFDPFFLSIPDMSSYCTSYSLTSQEGFNNFALIITETTSIDEITIDGHSLGVSYWREIPGTAYSWSEYSLGNEGGIHSMAHPNSPFGLLTFGIAERNAYGAMAICQSVPVPQPSCSSTQCRKKETCEIMNGDPVCVAQSSATCRAQGDPHYLTFDKRKYNFMGTCFYTLVKTCGSDTTLPAFHIAAKNENRGRQSVSYIGLVMVQVYGYEINMARKEYGLVRVNNQWSRLPISLHEGKLQLYQSGTFIVLETDFSLRVLYDWNSQLVVKISSSFFENVCGLCGNYNGDPADDFQTPSGSLAPSPVEFGKSWKMKDGDPLCWNDCHGECKDVTLEVLIKYKAEPFCGWISKRESGPFHQCHSVIDPEIFVENCAYDLYIYEGHKEALCQALKSYADACQREGVAISDWRRLTGCSLSCPENSQYKLCGSACLATCNDQALPTNCSSPGCVETCQCNKGFVLESGQCIPQAACGCVFEGRLLAPKEEFWGDNSCTRRCVCDPQSKQVRCQAASCKEGEQCKVEKGIQNCYPTSFSTCSAIGYSHYHTFDGQSFNFQGTCLYMFAGLTKKSKDLVDFKVLVRNAGQGGSSVSLNKLVTVQVYGMEISMSWTSHGRVMVNGLLTHLPYRMGMNQILIYQKGWNAVIRTDFGLTVTFDWKSHLAVTVPKTYEGALGGLCGNFNKDKEDGLISTDTGLASNSALLGQHWKVAGSLACEELTPRECPDLESTARHQRVLTAECGLLVDKSGPFRECHGKIDPELFFLDCVYDYCTSNGQKAVLRYIIAAYAEACQSIEVTIYSWRIHIFWKPVCPQNSHYELCARSCQPTCHSLFSPLLCSSHCAEGCVCDEGFVFSGGRCVPMAQCGCAYQDSYYSVGQTFYPTSKCNVECVCQAGGDVTCKQISCGPKEKCSIVDGIAKCHPVASATCSASGDPHYTSFDGLHFNFQGNCTYVLAKTATKGRNSLIPFTIREENEAWGSGRVSVTKMVSLEIYGFTLTLLQNKKGLVMVNGIFQSLPIILSGGQLRAYQHGTKVQMETGFGLIVSYDFVYHVTVTVPSTYQGQMEGLCGNYNGQKDDEFLLPGGSKGSNAAAFGAAWKVVVPGATGACSDGCSGSDCPTCEERKIDVFKQHNYCGILTASDGPFRACHSKVDPSMYFNDCIYDLCVGNGDSPVLCQSIQSYASACQEAKVPIQPWRSPEFCHPCQALRCRIKETCKVENGRATCVPDYNATAWGWGDPHLHTFDGLDFSFQGTCTYTLCKYCGNDPTLVPFVVDEKNDNRGSQAISYVRVVTISLLGYNISVHRKEVGKIRLNGVVTNLPVTLEDGKIQLFRSGLTAVLQTDFGLMVSYDWTWTVEITLSSSYYGTTCGLCGNFNQNPDDDMLMPTGIMASSVVEWAASWNVPDRDPFCWHVCEGNCPTCEESKRQLFETEEFCGLISKSKGGPFQKCHTKLNPNSFFDSCIYDVCLNGGAKSILCQALEAYATNCRKEGVVIQDWRTQSGCALPCPENSHYEACGNACPASCSDRSAPSTCNMPCVETCQCNEGYVLSTDKCVPVESCGCTHDGLYYKPNEEFWADENCRSYCHCDPKLGMVVCQPSNCKASERCTTVDGIRGCHPTSYATCTATGDHHYTTFDGKRYDFSGTCIYQLVGLCSRDVTLIPFMIKIQNSQGSKAMPFFSEITLEVYDRIIKISQKHPNILQVDGVFVDLPFYHEDKIKAYISGVHVVVKTKFDLTLTFSWNRLVHVKVPRSYLNAVCGLCGNDNGEPNDDLTMKDGSQATNVIQFANSWKIGEIPGCVDECTSNCPVCREEQKQFYKGDKYCGILLRKDGPFKSCHSAIDPTPYFDDCVSDTCKYKGHHDTFCSAISSYVTTCQAQGIQVGQWRSASFCSLYCPQNSHYDLCGNGCPVTCHSLSAPDGCEMSCKEGCYCNAGFVLSGDQCVPIGDCGCVYQERYYKKGDEFFPTSSCQEKCHCRENGVVGCQKVSCGAQEECKVEHGIRGCHSTGCGTCSVAGGTYLTFDGHAFNFPGSCTYTLAKVCSRDSNLAKFSVVVENESLGASKVVQKMVIITVHGYVITLKKGTTWKVSVDGEVYTLPLVIDRREVWVSQEGKNIVVHTDFGLSVLYDSSHYLLIYIPTTYQGHVCGLCGNFNGDRSDELQLPSEVITRNVTEFGASWKVLVDDARCTDGCRHNCPSCDATKTRQYQAESACGLILSKSGSFSDCHAFVKPTEYFNHCVYEMCAADGAKYALCQSLQAYVAACQAAGRTVKSWRTSFCPLTCPANSHYELCTRSCDLTCAGLSAPLQCTTKCFEGCQCNAGYVSDGEACVPMNQCGCMHNGHYIKAAETVISKDCSEKCTCHASGRLTCEGFSCGKGKTCALKNGTRGCVTEEAQCFLAPGGQLTTFDGASGEILYNGIYEIASLRDASASGWFRVLVNVRESGDGEVMAGAAVYVFFRETFIAISRGKEVWVNGQPVQLPAIVSEVISVHFSDNIVTLSHGTSLQVLFDLKGEVTVKVKEALEEKLIASCGNFNGNSSDDLTLPNGKVVGNIAEVIDAWKARDFIGCD